MKSYTSLQTFQHCQRLYGFGLFYKPWQYPEPIETGILVHKGISAHFKGDDWRGCLMAAFKESVESFKQIKDKAKQAELQSQALESLLRAQELSERFIAQQSSFYTNCSVEDEYSVEQYPLGGMVFHPDMIADYQGKRAVVEFKTSRNPDLRWYDFSGQADLYALLVPEKIDLVCYEIISEEILLTHCRLPKLDKADRILQQIRNLPEVAGPEAIAEMNPSLQWLCPSHCQFFIPCWLIETAGDFLSYLDKEFVKNE